MHISTPLALYCQWKKRSLKPTRRGPRRRRIRSRGDDVVAPRVPLDLLIEILTRLPAKSLMRFKCVSKQWSTLIRSRYFSNRYVTVASQPRPPRLYISFVDKVDEESVLLPFSFSSSSSSDESFDLDLTMLGAGGHNLVALRGLILYTVCAKACIYNPTTRQSVTLLAVSYNMFAQGDLRKEISYFLGYDPVLDQYKVVCTVVIFSDDFERLTSEHWVFVLEPRGFWKRIQFDQHHKPTIFEPPCINGVIYYLASTDIYDHIVFSFDVRSEEFNMIQVPDVLNKFGGSVTFMGIIEYCGKPTIIDHTYFKEKGLLDLWILEDAAGKWSRKPLGLQPCQMHLVDEIDVEGTTPKGEVIMSPKPWCSPYYLLYYDVQKNHLRKVQVGGIRDCCWFRKSFIYATLDNYESIMHLEI